MTEFISQMIIIVSGLPGSGKSYFAERLAGKLKAVYLSSDKLRKSMEAEGKYRLEDKMHIYSEMANLAEASLDRGQTVVVDATFYHHGMRELFIHLALAHDVTIIFIKVSTSEELTRQRLAKPRNDSEADLGVYESMKLKFEPYTTDHLELHSGNDNISEMLALAMGYLQSKNEKH